jgi:catechol 2,3-dioxygenase-like lactoylglutathione lyase family enzyme
MARWKRGAYLAAGELWVCLSVDEAAGSMAVGGSSHVAFSVDEAGFGALRERILAAGAREWKANRSEGESLYFLDPDGHRLEIHVGDLRSRIEACRKMPYEGMEIFE